MATKTQGFVLGCAILLAASALVLAAAALVVRSAGGGGDFLGTKEKIGLVLLQGPLVDPRRVVDEIEAHGADEDVRAVVLRVDSPGGDVAASQEIYAAVGRLASRKPLVASIGSMAASGAYYALVPADSIVADPGSVVGSIGVVFTWPEATELMSKAGVRLNVYKSGSMKDLGSFARSPTEEEDAVIDGLIADVFDQFLDAVEAHRPLDRDRLLELADGRVFTGRQAREVGLVDHLGDLHDALDIAAALAGLPPDAPVVRKERRRLPLLDLLDDLLRDNAEVLLAPRLEYRLR